MAKNNKPASSYAQPHTMTGKGMSVKDSLNNGGFRPDPNTMAANGSEPGGNVPARRVSLGDITREPKSTGIVTRGNGAATKGITARGPMA